MKAKVLGIQAVDYVNKKNQQVTGTSFHVTHEDSHVSGLKCESIFCSARYDIAGINSVKIGDTVDFAYNRYGGVDSIVTIMPAK